jgi:plasmid stabilization system protein ParE
VKLRFTPPAVFELTAIADHIRERNPAAAARVRSSILKSLDNLTVFPRMGRKQSTPGVRKPVTRRYSYLVYYRVDMDAREVVVLHIRHPARKRKYKNA